MGNKARHLAFCLLPSLLCLVGCDVQGGGDGLAFAFGDSLRLTINDELPLETNLEGSTYSIDADPNVATLEDNMLSAHSYGSFSLTASNGDKKETIEVEIVNSDGELQGFRQNLYVETSIELTSTRPGRIVQLGGFEYANLEGTTVSGIQVGTAYFQLQTDEGVSPLVSVDVLDMREPSFFVLSASSTEVQVGYDIEIRAVCTPMSYEEMTKIEVISGEEFISFDGTTLRGVRPGKAVLRGSVGPFRTESLEITVINAVLNEPETFRIYTDDHYLGGDETANLSFGVYPASYGEGLTYVAEGDVDAFEIKGSTVKSLEPGKEIWVRARTAKGDLSTNAVAIRSLDGVETKGDHILTFTRQNVGLGTTVSYTVESRGDDADIELVNGIVDDWDLSTDGRVIPQNLGAMGIFVARNGNAISNEATLSCLNSNPYSGLLSGEDAFYAAYEEAFSNQDAIYRSQLGYISGQKNFDGAAPVENPNKPTESGRFIKNNMALYTESGSGYYLTDENGIPSREIFAAGGYIGLNELASYLYAFGDVPANHVDDKNATPRDSIWGMYLRVNNTSFSGSTSSYPYEPVLPNISGEGGNLRYYEVDFGTSSYNGGMSISRGNCRFVYSRYYRSGGGAVSLDDRYVFYTYNHYNDFQEFLNYEGGWGEIFGKVTAGGIANTDYGPEPSPYVPIVKRNLYELGA